MDWGYRKFFMDFYFCILERCVIFYDMCLLIIKLYYVCCFEDKCCFFLNEDFFLVKECRLEFVVFLVW